MGLTRDDLSNSSPTVITDNLDNAIFLFSRFSTRPKGKDKAESRGASRQPSPARTLQPSSSSSSISEDQAKGAAEGTRLGVGTPCSIPHSKACSSAAGTTPHPTAPGMATERLVPQGIALDGTSADVQS
ncbi:hypothetical protein C0995_002416 [Termitomyces sp. Mi166|nr:hypothetical protein C0995_002416 [Termitomyces sp. Mi166\